MSYRLRLTRRSSIDEPAELADGPHARRWDLTATGADRGENRLLLAASHEKRDAPAAFNHWIGYCDAHLRARPAQSGVISSIRIHEGERDVAKADFPSVSFSI